MVTREIIDIIHRVSGLSENQAKTVVYYCMATHKLRQFDWFPALAFVGAPGTGKSKTIDVIEKLCYKPYRITCHATMSPASLRDEMVAAKNRTALIEEVDLYPNRKQLQSYLINRVDKLRTSGLAVKEQVETDSGVKQWKTRREKSFGATVTHDRHSLEDMAAESRAIVINTMFRDGTYIEPPQDMTLPEFKLGIVPDIFTKGRALDTWTPLIRVATGFNDWDWLNWVRLQIEEAVGELMDGQMYEEKLAIFAKVIESCCDSSGLGLMDKTLENGLVLQSSVVEPLKREMPYINPRSVSKILKAASHNWWKFDLAIS